MNTYIPVGVARLPNANTTEMILKHPVTMIAAGALFTLSILWLSGTLNRHVVQVPQTPEAKEAEEAEEETRPEPESAPELRRVRSRLLHGPLEKSPSVLNVNMLAQSTADSKHPLQPCFNAIMQGDDTALGTAIGEVLNVVDENGFSLLHTAANRGDIDCLRILINAKAQVDFAGENGMTALHFAAASGSLECVKALVGAGTNVNAAAADGFTPLHQAARKGHNQIVEYLLKQGAEKDAQTTDALYTPAILAAAGGFSECIKTLKSQNANLDQADNMGWTPLHFAANGVPLSADVQPASYTMTIGALTANGANVTLTDTQGQLPLHVAALAGNVESVGGLLPHCQRIVDQKDNANQTALYLAASGGHTEVIEVLIQWNADPKTDADGYTPLHAAAEGGHIEAARKLLEKGVLINAKADDGCTPLFDAAFAGQEAMVTFLLGQNADPTLTGPESKTPAAIATEQGHHGVAGILAGAAAQRSKR